MNKAKKHYYKLLHYYYVKGLLNEEEFNVITTLTDQEVDDFFSLSRRQVFKIINLFSYIAQYQRAKLNHTNSDWLHLRKKIKLRYCLWSDTAFFEYIPENIQFSDLGLSILAKINRRKVIVWSLRFGITLPNIMIEIRQPNNLKPIILRSIAKQRKLILIISLFKWGSKEYNLIIWL